MKTRIRKLKENLLGDISSKSVLNIPYFVFTISIIVTISITYYFYSNSKTLDSRRFDNDVIKINAALENRLDTYIALLRAGRGFFRSTDKINKQNFAEFVENLNLRKLYPGVQGIGYSKVFTAQEKADLEKRMRSEGFPDFVIKPETGSEVSQAIIYIEPFDEKNQKAHGFDMSSEATRKQALDSARDSGNYATSGKVTLLQEKDENDPQSGFLIYLPVYKGEKPPDTIEDRQKQLDGFIYSPFRAFEFIKDVINESKIATVSFKIYDNEINQNSLIGIGNDSPTIINSGLEEQTEIDVGGRKWVVEYAPIEKFRAQSLTWWTPIIFLLGLATSVILFFLSLSQSRTNIKLYQIANELAQSEEEVQKLLESEQNAREIAEKSSRVKDEFISIVSHEMRTPLNSIGGWVQILKSDVLTKETKKQAIEKISKNLRSQVNLVDDMIDFSDESFLTNQSKWKKIQIVELLDDCINENLNRINGQNITLQRKFSTEKLYISGEKEKIKKAILYLLDNSIKFTPKNGSVGIELAVENQNVEIMITDTGEGITPEQLANIFVVFNQSDSSTTRRHTGLGLSLAIVKKIIEGHNGEVFAQSQGKNKGATFTLRLPVSMI